MGAEQEIHFEHVRFEVPLPRPVGSWLWESGALVQAGVGSIPMSLELSGWWRSLRSGEVEEERAPRTEPQGTPEVREYVKLF